ncbi:hypothetical protein N0V90_001970 [Kalmusia sp. IMI 367209]|nr:hypothetical protein N0V90_001970 [Kalmusia sp. IMI 367209]
MPRNQPNSPSPPPPLSGFPYAGPGFDFPEASASPPPSRTTTSAHSRMNQLTDFLSQQYQISSTEREDVPPRRLRTEPRRRPAARTAQIPRHAEREPGTINTQRNSPLVTGRPTATPSERYLLRRAHARVRDVRSVIEDPATDVLDSLSNMPPNPFHASHSSRRERSPTSGSDGPRRQTKRRKLDHPARPASEYDGFKYGYKGQVVRGRLRMEVVSCDGGEYDRGSSLYKVQNVLSNDKSVYCSQSGRCNLLLKHIGEMPFCLEKVVIRAPDRGFTAPVQEGLIFVAMSPDKLLSGTSAYEIEYNPKASSPPPLSPDPSHTREIDDELLSFQEAIMDEAVWVRSRQTMTERIERLGLRNRRSGAPPIPSVTRDHQHGQQSADEDDGFNECPYHIEEGDSNAAGVSAPTPPPFTTTTESEPEDSEETEALPSAAIMADRLRRESRYRSEGEDDDELEDLIHQPFETFRRAQALQSLERYTPESERRWYQRYDPIRATRLQTPSSIKPKNPQADSEDLIQPHARFFIARHKNKITIKFHPTISGKHVLLKLWSPTHDGNIDIESVQFYGYSGPRFFPAVQPR